MKMKNKTLYDCFSECYDAVLEDLYSQLNIEEHPSIAQINKARREIARLTLQRYEMEKGKEVKDLTRKRIKNLAKNCTL